MYSAVYHLPLAFAMKIVQRTARGWSKQGRKEVFDLKQPSLGGNCPHRVQHSQSKYLLEIYGERWMTRREGVGEVEQILIVHVGQEILLHSLYPRHDLDHCSCRRPPSLPLILSFRLRRWPTTLHLLSHNCYEYVPIVLRAAMQIGWQRPFKTSPLSLARWRTCC